MCKDEDSSEDSNELNSQLFAAARTNELLTSLRYFFIQIIGLTFIDL